jgi:PAS domain S-box-containing protein
MILGSSNPGASESPVQQQGSAANDPLLKLALVATSARNPRELWQETARVLGEATGSGFVRIDYTDPVASGWVEWGVAGSSERANLTFSRGERYVEVKCDLPETDLPLGRVGAVVEAAEAMVELVGRRMTLEHERRLGSFIVELSRWMLASAADPGMLLRYTLESILQLVEGQGAMVVLNRASGAGLDVVSTAGCMSDGGEELLDLIRPAVGQVVEREAPFLTQDLGAAVEDGVPEESRSVFASAMFVPLRNTERVGGALCVARSASEQNAKVPFDLNDVGYVEAVASHIAGGLELSKAICRAREAAERAGAMVDGTPYPLALLSRDGTVLRLNDAFAKLVGTGEKESILGAPIASCGLTVGKGSWNDALTAAESGVPWHSRVDTERDGELRYCDAIVTPLQDAEEGALLLALHDRTEELRAQRELVTREKLATVGEIASGVAHEVNNPLATIRLEAELLGGASAEPETAKTVETIIREVDRAARIAKGLLCLSRQSMSGADLVRINELIQSVLDVRGQVARSRGIVLVSDLSEAVPEIAANGGDLQQVFVNLITNAEFAVRGRERRHVVVSSSLVDGKIRVAVSDSGPGVDPDLRTRIFDPFFTTKDPDVGTGLGLALSQRIITDHEGRIWVEESELGGACFVVELSVGDQGTS